MSRIKRFLAVVLTVATLSGLLVTGAGAADFTRSRTYTEGMFSDVPANAWYASSVKDCYELGLMSGNTDGTFNPSGMFTLAEAATVAARLHSIHHGGSGVIPSADGAWYQGAVNYCIENGIFDAGQFGDYNNNATRAQMAGMVYNALPAEAWAAINSVSALPDVSDTTLNSAAIFALYNAGVFTGSDEYGMFHPHANITRAEVSAIVARVADTAQRRTLSLTPLSAKPAVVLGEDADIDLSSLRVSEGHVIYRNSKSNLYGHVASDGTVVAPKYYYYHFEDGYAIVDRAETEDQGYTVKYGIIDSHGNEVLPLEYDRIERTGYREYVASAPGMTRHIRDGKIVSEYAVDVSVGYINYIYNADHIGALNYVDNRLFSYGESNNIYSSGLMTRDGKIITSPKYSTILKYGSCIVCKYGETRDIFDLNGNLIASLTGEEEWNSYAYPGRPEPWVYQEGEKYGLAGHNGKITEALYDSIHINGNSLAELKYGEQEALAGLNGVILELGEYIIYAIEGDYALVRNADGYAFADATGIICEVPPELKPKELVVLDNVLFATRDYDTMFAYDTVTGQSYNSDQTEYSHYCYRYGENYILRDGTRIAEPPTDVASGFYTFKTLNGKYGVIKGSDIQQPLYDTPEATLAASPREYILTKENGKPIVTCGNVLIGYTPVIQYYQGNFYYDEIKEIGDGYFACRYNTTWYLLRV